MGMHDVRAYSPHIGRMQHYVISYVMSYAVYIMLFCIPARPSGLISTCCQCTLSYFTFCIVLFKLIQVSWVYALNCKCFWNSSFFTEVEDPVLHLEARVYCLLRVNLSAPNSDHKQVTHFEMNGKLPVNASASHIFNFAVISFLCYKNIVMQYFHFQTTANNVYENYQGKWSVTEISNEKSYVKWSCISMWKLSQYWVYTLQW